MPQRNKKTKKRDADRHRQEDIDINKHGKSKNVEGGWEGLNAHFTFAELQELRTVLQTKDLTTVPLLMAAAILNKDDVVKEAIRNGSNLNEAGPNHFTALMWSVKRKNMDMIEYLLANGADPTLKNVDGDGVLFLALDDQLWDEKSYLALWNRIKIVSFVDVDFTSKRRGRNLVHTAIARKWCDMLDMLIMEKANVNVENSNGFTPLMLASKNFDDCSMVNALLSANADLLKEDGNGCTALCYALSCYIRHEDGRQAADTPRSVVDTLIRALEKKGITFKEFFKNRIDGILTRAACNRYGQSDTMAMDTSIVSYSLRYCVDVALQALFEIDIFGRIAEASRKNILEKTQLLRYSTITNAIVKYCEHRFNSPEEKQLLDMFITSGCADTCLLILKTYGFNDSKEFDFVRAAFEPLITVCILQAVGKVWLRENCLDAAELMLLYGRSDTDRDESIEFDNKKLAQFQQLLGNVQREDMSAPSPSQWPYVCQRIQVNDCTSAMEPKQDSKQNSKKTKRRARALKAKIAKIKSADLTERLNRKKILEQKCASDTSVKAKRLLNSISNARDNDDAATHSKSTKRSAWNQIWFVDGGNGPPMRTLNGTIETLRNLITITCANNADDIFNVDLESEFTTKEDISTAFVGPLDDGGVELTKTMVGDEVAKTTDYTLAYLSGLLRTIIITYRDHWDRDREEERASQNYHSEAARQGHSTVSSGSMKGAKEQLELEERYLGRVRAEFDRLSATIRTNSENLCYYEHKELMEKLETLFLNHECRGETISMDDSSPPPHTTVGSDGGGFCGKRNFFETHNHQLLQYINTALSPPSRNGSEGTNSYPNVEEYEALLRDHPDAPYLRALSALRTKHMPDPRKVECDRMKTMKHAYHLTSSIMSVCDQNEDAMLTFRKLVHHDATRHEHQGTPTTNNGRRRTLRETLLATPRTDGSDNYKILEKVESAAICDNEAAFPISVDDMVPSRWCGIVQSLRSANDHRVLLNGDIRIGNCRMNQEDPHIISSGGNFSSVVLGLDSSDRPLAVKRIRKESVVCKMMKKLINPLLGLRNANLLHYFSCNYEDADLVLATPLCEYNMGEYVMLMKRSPNNDNAMYTKCVDVVKQFLAGLRFLHDRPEPIIHGNLKPSNIFVDLRGTVRIAEFGMHKALYTLIDAPNTSIIWFARETYAAFKESSYVACTCASDVQVAGMLIHFVLTAGKHPYGEAPEDILKNLERSTPQLTTGDVDLHDLISWMLLHEPGERPSVNQALSHVFFWNADRKWRFILACAGVSPHGTPLDISLNELHLYINVVAAKENIKGRWIGTARQAFPNLIYSKDDQDSITGLLRFIRNCVQNQIVLHMDADREFRAFILLAFHALPLSLYRILESSRWLNHSVLHPFTTVDSLSA